MICIEHIEHLAESGITRESAELAGLSTQTGETVRKLLNWPEDRSADALGSCLCFPYRHYWSETFQSWRDDGPLVRVRPDSPRKLPSSKSFKPAKYESPIGLSPTPYVPREWSSLQDDRSKTLIITEGEKKALALNSNGWPAVGLPGIWTFKAQDKKNLAPEILALAHPGRKVLIAFDTDLRSNPQIIEAATQLANLLLKQKCQVEFYCPPSWVKAKGIDDQLVQFGVAGLRQAITAWSRPIDIEDWTNALLSAVANSETPVSKTQFLEEIRIAGRWLKSLWKGKKKEKDARIKDWINRVRSCVADVYSLTNVELSQAIESSRLPEGVNPADQPWEICVDGMTRIFKFEDEPSWLPAGDSELLGTSHTDAARFLVGKWGIPTIFYRGSIRQYSAGVWIRRSEDWLQREILLLNKERTAQGQELVVNKTTADGIQTQLARYLAYESEVFWSAGSSRWLCFYDLSVSWDPQKQELTTAPHSPLHRTELKFPVAWVARPNVEQWDSTLLEWCYPNVERYPEWSEDQRLREMSDKANLIKYWIGASLLMGARYVGKALALVGGPGTGKSTFCSLISGLWPEERVTAIPLQKLGEEYPAADLAESALNVVSELPASKAGDVEAIKAAVSACDRMYARRIYGATFSFVPAASHLIGMNQWPTLRDYSGAIWDRFYTIRFENRYRDSGREDKSLRERLEKEKAGILISCLLFAARYLKTKTTPPIPLSSGEEISDARESSDPIQEWIAAETFLSTNGSSTTQKLLFESYLKWADEHKRGVISSKKFSQALSNKGISSRKKSDGRHYSLILKTSAVESLSDEIENLGEILQ